MNIGIDIGGSHIAVGLVDDKANIIAKKEHNWTKEEKTNLIDFIQDNSNNPELGLLSNEEFKELYTKISHELTSLEECVFKLKIQGFSYKEIADILDKEEKSIDNAIQRIKVKIKSLMTKNA